jgi:hypothetical protein
VAAGERTIQGAQKSQGKFQKHSKRPQRRGKMRACPSFLASHVELMEESKQHGLKKTHLLTSKRRRGKHTKKAIWHG